MLQPRQATSHCILDPEQRTQQQRQRQDSDREKTPFDQMHGISTARRSGWSEADVLVAPCLDRRPGSSGQPQHLVENLQGSPVPAQIGQPDRWGEAR